MNLSVVALIKLGYRYLLLWPKRAELAQFFSEYKTIQFARIILNITPGLAVFSLIINIGMQSQSSIAIGIFYFILLTSMPIQALVMLGMKADKVLPPSLSTWYKEGVTQYIQQGGNIKLTAHKPRYIDLATLLNMTYHHPTK